MQDLLSKTQDLDEMQAVIFSHEHFGESEVLLAALIKQYRVLASQELDTFRVINFIKNWIKIEKPKFTNQLRELGTLLSEFIATLPETYVSLFKTCLSDTAEEDDEEPERGLHAKKSDGRKKNEVLLNINPKSVAMQLTLVDLELIKDIDFSELLRSSWTQLGRAPSLEKIAARANNVVHWIAYELLVVKVKYRVKLTAHLLSICQELMVLQNFQSLMCIYLAFNLQPIEKIGCLHAIKTNLNYLKHFRIWEEVCEIFDYSNNFRNYRNKIKSLQIPMIISQEIMLKDLLFNDESLPNFELAADGVTQVVNATKLFTMGYNFVNLWKCRGCIYKFPISKPSSYLKNLPVFTLEFLCSLADDKTTLVYQIRKGKLSPADLSRSESSSFVGSDSVTRSLDSTQDTSEPISKESSSKKMKNFGIK